MTYAAEGFFGAEPPREAVLEPAHLRALIGYLGLKSVEEVFSVIG